jgi:hypothetical protein
MSSYLCSEISAQCILVQRFSFFFPPSHLGETTFLKFLVPNYITNKFAFFWLVMLCILTEVHWCFRWTNLHIDCYAHVWLVPGSSVVKFPFFTDSLCNCLSEFTVWHNFAAHGRKLSNSKKVPKRWHTCTVFCYFLQVAVHVSRETFTHNQELD